MAIEDEAKAKDDSDADEEELEDKWISHYSSLQQILLVGDGDFSFSLSLAVAFVSASNIVTTSFDQYDVVTKKYSLAKSNLEKLAMLGATIIHGVDAKKMKLHPDLSARRFDRIIFNFPHAGFHGKEDELHLIRSHRTLLRGFFRNASQMLRPYGEVHVAHKTGVPYNRWNVEELASENHFALIECVDFHKADYPGYKNKRGDGARCDEPFRLGKCCTYKFRINTQKVKTTSEAKAAHIHRQPLKDCQFRSEWGIGRNYLPPSIPTAFETSSTRDSFEAPDGIARAIARNGILHVAGNQANPAASQVMQGLSNNSPSEELAHFFRDYFRNVYEMFGRADYDVAEATNRYLTNAYVTCMNESPEGICAYVRLLEELHFLSKSRIERLRMRLLDPSL